jgi:hypothetical protein
MSVDESYVKLAASQMTRVGPDCRLIVRRFLDGSASGSSSGSLADSQSTYRKGLVAETFEA